MRARCVRQYANVVALNWRHRLLYELLPLVCIRHGMCMVWVASHSHGHSRIIWKGREVGRPQDGAGRGRPSFEARVHAVMTSPLSCAVKLGAAAWLSLPIWVLGTMVRRYLGTNAQRPIAAAAAVRSTAGALGVGDGRWGGRKEDDATGLGVWKVGRAHMRSVSQSVSSVSAYSFPTWGAVPLVGRSAQSSDHPLLLLALSAGCVC